MTRPGSRKRVELHAHLGSSVNPVIMWTIAHEQGIKLPSKDYWDFEEMITMSEDDRNADLLENHEKYFHWTQLIQSSPQALDMSVHSVIGGGYRKCNIVIQELRFNPMRRNRAGERDLDHTILSALWGMKRALLEYPQVKAGVILEMDRRFPYEQNEVILEKAIRYAGDGVVGVDVSGPATESFSMEQHAPLFLKAKDAGLGVTIHTGEEGDLDEVRYVVEHIKPDRIGHGVQAAEDPKLLEQIRESNITLEFCPISNIKNSIIKDVDGVRKVAQAFKEHGVKFTINTDGPEMYQTNVEDVENFLVENDILSNAEVEQATQWAFEASFVDRS